MKHLLIKVRHHTSLELFIQNLINLRHKIEIITLKIINYYSYIITKVYLKI